MPSVTAPCIFAGNWLFDERSGLSAAGRAVVAPEKGTTAGSPHSDLQRYLDRKLVLVKNKKPLSEVKTDEKVKCLFALNG